MLTVICVSEELMTETVTKVTTENVAVTSLMV